MTNIRVSAQAFLQEIQTWNSTLNRQTQKLTVLKSNVKNKFKLNSIDIVLTEIQSIQIKYKKIQKKYRPILSSQNRIPNLQSHNQKSLSDELLNQYTQLSKIFMEILQKISMIEGQSDEPNLLIENFQGSQSRKKSQSLLNQNDKTFLNDTFAFKVSKSRKDNNKSIFEKRKQTAFKENTSRVKTHSMITKMSDISNISTQNQPINKKQIITVKQFKSEINEESSNLWQIRHQLNTITQMMKQMKNQIQYHQHEDTNRQINKIQTKNRKMASQLKSIKEGNRLILEKIEDLKKQLMEEKKGQVDLINRFQKRSGNSKYNLYDSIATHADNYISVQGDKSSQTNRKNEYIEDVSDWVKMRI